MEFHHEILIITTILHWLKDLPYKTNSRIAWLSIGFHVLPTPVLKEGELKLLWLRVKG